MSVTLQGPVGGPAVAAPPPRDLRDVVDTFWRMDLSKSAGPIRVAADAKTEIIWILRADEAPRLVVAGPLHASLIEPGTGRLIGVGLAPHAAGAVLGAAAAELRGDTAGTEDLGWRSTGEFGVETSVSTADAYRSLANLLRRRLARSRTQPDPLVAAARRLMRRARVGTKALAKRLDVSERTLHRRFVAAAGVGPKTVERLIRARLAYQAVLWGDASLAEIASTCGYFDQAHMTNEFVEFAGVGPAALRRGLP